MRILFLGDVVGREGRDAVIEQTPILRKKYNLDAIIVNGENAAGGFGITAQICDDFYKVGVDCITTGNHIWKQRSIIPYISGAKKLIRPINYPEKNPGNGSYIIVTPKEQKILVVNALGRLYMSPIDSPFDAIDKFLKTTRLKNEVDAIVIDMHAEATSEKQAMAHYLDGRVSLVVGTHTHVPTSDTRILSGGTGAQTDAGMCGCYDGVLGATYESSISVLTGKVPHERLTPAKGEATLCGTIIETNNKTGLCDRIEPLVMGGNIKQCLPSF